MNKPSFILTCAQILCAGLILSGCNKGHDAGAPDITIKGRILKDCSGAPVAGMTLDFYVMSDNAPTAGKSGVIGTTTTDAQGNFSVTASNFGEGTLSVYQNFDDPRAYRFVYNFPVNSRMGTEIGLGNVYYHYKASLTVKFSRAANSPTDTLYFGQYRNNPFGSAAGNAIDNYIFHTASDRVGEQLPYAEVKKWVWGIGIEDYNKAVGIMDAMKNNNNPVYYHLINVPTGVCTDDTAFVKL